MESQPQGKTDDTAFEGMRRIASGALAEVALAAKRVLDRGERAPVLIFNDATGEQVEVDVRGTDDAVRNRLALRVGAGTRDAVPAPDTPRGPGRPKLGVVAREVTLVPRHWDRLNSQPGGATVALRKRVEEARRTHAARDRIRHSQEATYRFMSALAGNLPGFEEAARALFGHNAGRFAEQIRDWPEDVQKYLTHLGRECLRPEQDENSAPARPVKG
jgi:hypothetical protein